MNVSVIPRVSVTKFAHLPQFLSPAILIHAAVCLCAGLVLGWLCTCFLGCRYGALTVICEPGRYHITPSWTNTSNLRSLQIKFVCISSLVVEFRRSHLQSPLTQNASVISAKATLEIIVEKSSSVVWINRDCIFHCMFAVQFVRKSGFFPVCKQVVSPLLEFHQRGLGFLQLYPRPLSVLDRKGQATFWLGLWPHHTRDV